MENRVIITHLEDGSDHNYLANPAKLRGYKSEVFELRLIYEDPAKVLVPLKAAAKPRGGRATI